MYIVEFTMEYVLVEEVLMDVQQNTIEREPHEVLHDFFLFFFILFFDMKFYILIQF